MKETFAIHIVEGEPRSRAEQARTVFALGHHAEVYETLDELLARPPRQGILLIGQRAVEGDFPALFDRLSAHDLWLPVVISAANPQLPEVVQAVKQGALDYLGLPLEINRLAASIAVVAREARAYSAARRRLNHARSLIRLLSRREREVLEWLAEGSSNKVIARQLSISPRTVEIHRANMMAKIGARHSAEAVRLWLEAGLECVAVPDGGEGAELLRLVAGRNALPLSLRQRDEFAREGRGEPSAGPLRRSGPG